MTSWVSGPPRAASPRWSSNDADWLRCSRRGSISAWAGGAGVVAGGVHARGVVRGRVRAAAGSRAGHGLTGAPMNASMELLAMLDRYERRTKRAMLVVGALGTVFTLCAGIGAIWSAAIEAEHWRTVASAAAGGWCLAFGLAVARDLWRIWRS